LLCLPIKPKSSNKHKHKTNTKQTQTQTQTQNKHKTNTNTKPKTIMLRTFARSLATARPLLQQQRFGSTLVLAEVGDDGNVAASTLSAIQAGSQLGDVTVLVCGDNDAAVASVGKANGVSKILQAKTGTGMLPEEIAPVIVASQSQFNFSHIVAAATAAGKNILPRVAAKLDVAMVSEVTEIESEDTFIRQIYAGNAVCKVKSNDTIKVMTIRPTNFEPVGVDGGSPPTEDVAADGQSLSKWVSHSLAKSDRPSLTSAGNIVAGGRGMGKDGKGAENFGILDTLADKLGAAVGASRAAVDAGYVPNELQIGQTGKIVAPELYIAVGISGAIQHLAGMKDSKVIVAINKDAEAPIFQVADYGLVADLYSAVPELTEKL